MAAKIRGGKVKSIASLKSSLKKGGGSQYLTRVPAEGSLTVRFLAEPDDEGNGWVAYYEHYDSVRKFYPCSDDCPGCLEGDKPSARYLANALDVAEARVIPLVLPKSLASSVLKKYEKYSTLLDRDYELSRSGTGFDTEYDVTPESPTKMNIGRFDLIDLEEILQSQLDMAEGSPSSKGDDDDEEEEERPSRTPAAKRPKSKAVDEDDEDDDDDESDEEEDSEESAEEDDDGEGALDRDDLMAMSLAELKSIAKESGFTLADLRGKDKDAIADMILDSSGSDEEDEEVISEDDLKAMSLSEVKALAKEYGVRFKAGTSKDDIIELILDAAAEDDDDEEEMPF